jgi:hypothetical protein
MTDPIDTARAEGIALGLAMAIHEMVHDDDISRMGGAKRKIAALSPIPPRVAAARVLLDLMDPAIWRPALAASREFIAANEDELMGAVTAALEQIAGGANG